MSGYQENLTGDIAVTTSGSVVVNSVTAGSINVVAGQINIMTPINITSGGINIVAGNAAVMSRTPPIVFVSEYLNQNVVTALNTSNVAGVLVPGDGRQEIVHLAVTKAATCTVKVYGWTDQIFAGTAASGIWLQADTVTFSENNEEVAMLRGLAGFKRLQTTINAIGTTNVNAYWGFANTRF